MGIPGVDRVQRLHALRKLRIVLKFLCYFYLNSNIENINCLRTQEKCYTDSTHPVELELSSESWLNGNKNAKSFFIFSLVSPGGFHIRETMMH